MPLAAILTLISLSVLLGYLVRKAVQEHRRRLLARVLSPSEWASYQLTTKEFVRVSQSLRHICNYLGTYVEIDLSLSRLVHLVGGHLEHMVNELPTVLRTWDGEGPKPRFRASDQASAIDSLVAELDDRDITRLWASGSPHDCAEIIRHALFLAVYAHSARGAGHPLSIPEVFEPGLVWAQWNQLSTSNQSITS